MPTVIIAEDHQLMAEGYALLIEQIEGLEILERVTDGYEALRSIDHHNPDLLILDLHMPRLNGLETLRHLSVKHVKTKVIVISMYGSAAILKEVKKLGAKGYLLKHAEQEEFIMAIKLILKGKVYYSSELYEEQTKVDKLINPGTTPIDVLSKREEQVLKLITKGYTNNEIAEELFLSPKTVDSHRTNLMKKLGAHNVTDLVRYALTNGYDV